MENSANTKGRPVPTASCTMGHHLKHVTGQQTTAAYDGGDWLAVHCRGIAILHILLNTRAQDPRWGDTAKNAVEVEKYSNSMQYITAKIITYIKVGILRTSNL